MVWYGDFFSTIFPTHTHSDTRKSCIENGVGVVDFKYITITTLYALNINAFYLLNVFYSGITSVSNSIIFHFMHIVTIDNVMGDMTIVDVRFFLLPLILFVRSMANSSIGECR